MVRGRHNVPALEWERLARRMGRTAAALRTWAWRNRLPRRRRHPWTESQAAPDPGRRHVAICPVTLHQRIAHSHAFNSGRCAAETEPGTKAAAKLVQLYEWFVSARALPQADTKATA